MNNLALRKESIPLYGWLPINIFTQSSLEECFNSELLFKRAAHYNFCNGVFNDKLRDTDFKADTDDIVSNSSLINEWEKLINNNTYYWVEQIKLWLEDSDDDTRFYAAKMIQFLPDYKKRKELIDKAWYWLSINKLWSIENHDLYKYKWFSSSKKSSDDALILVDKYEGSAYQRIMNLKGFLVWKKALESFNIREREWREYVPIEPILSFRLQIDGKIKVVSKIMHCSLTNFIKMEQDSGLRLYTGQLRAQKKKIVEALLKMWIVHNDAFDRNFCIQFFYTENGDIDITQCPRLYLIDRDRAEYKKISEI